MNKLSSVILYQLILLMLTTAQATTAQETLMKQINAVKLADKDYAWAESTHQQADSALAHATRNLLNRLWLDDNLSCDINDVKPHLKHLTMKRGHRNYVLAYLKRSDLPATLPLIGRLRTCQGFKAADDLLSKEMEDGHIDSLCKGAWPNMHVVIFRNTEELPVAILSPERTVGSTLRLNYLTGQPDSTANYRRHYAISFTTNP